MLRLLHSETSVTGGDSFARSTLPISLGILQGRSRVVIAEDSDDTTHYARELGRVSIYSDADRSENGNAGTVYSSVHSVKKSASRLRLAVLLS